MLNRERLSLRSKSQDARSNLMCNVEFYLSRKICSKMQLKKAKMVTAHDQVRNLEEGGAEKNDRKHGSIPPVRGRYIRTRVLMVVEI